MQDQNNVVHHLDPELVKHLAKICKDKDKTIGDAIEDAVIIYIILQGSL